MWLILYSVQSIKSINQVIRGTHIYIHIRLGHIRSAKSINQKDPIVPFASPYTISYHTIFKYIVAQLNCHIPTMWNVTNSKEWVEEAVEIFSLFLSFLVPLIDIIHFLHINKKISNQVIIFLTLLQFPVFLLNTTDVQVVSKSVVHFHSKGKK